MSQNPTDPKPAAPLPKQDGKTPVQDSRSAGIEEPTMPLDLSRLDLSVEKVEERISPSETNVFDK